MIKLYDLSPEEKKVIIDKWIEHPGVGEYDNFFQDWTYICRQCHTPLYRSRDKFDAHCWWPAFDDAIPWAVKWTTDEDGYRTEITCAVCWWHLGHVFIGEQETDTNVRHCVNSLSMKFIKEIIDESDRDAAVFAGGCFWCLEAVFQRLKWVIEVQNGFSGWTLDFPSYEQVARMNTGHAEVVRIIFDPTVISYEQLLEVFFTMHNPTTLYRQWPDEWPEYRSAVFYNSVEQKEIVEQVIKKATEERRWPDPIVTQLEPLEKFWLADWSHQDYYNQNKDKFYCQVNIDPKIAKLREKWKGLMK